MAGPSPSSASSAPIRHQIATAWPATGPGPLTHAPATPRRLSAALGCPLPARGQRIGLLGGSFNPAHGGHRVLSREALKRLNLDAVWWLVSPQNPLKPRRGMAPLAERVDSARAVVGDDPHIRVTTLESALGTLYTLDTLLAVRRRMPGVRFVWLMGADNVLQISRWANWPSIFQLVPIAVFNRPTYSWRIGCAKAAHRFARARLPEGAAPALVDRRPPAWVFLHRPADPRSATAIRARRHEDRLTGT